MKRLMIIGALLGVLLTGCGNPNSDGATQPSPETPADPYDAYQAVADEHPDWVELTREDAQTRAYLGCSVEWAPGTQDYALHVAYAALCESTQ